MARADWSLWLYCSIKAIAGYLNHLGDPYMPLLFGGFSPKPAGRYLYSLPLGDIQFCANAPSSRDLQE
jgi:hypothetical protein